MPEGRVRWTKGYGVYTGAGADKAVFEALPEQFASPSSLHLPEVHPKEGPACGRMP